MVSQLQTIQSFTLYTAQTICSSNPAPQLLELHPGGAKHLWKVLISADPGCMNVFAAVYIHIYVNVVHTLFTCDMTLPNVIGSQVSVPSLLRWLPPALTAVSCRVSLRLLISSGEPLTWQLAVQLQGALPARCTLLNIYGKL